MNSVFQIRQTPRMGRGIFALRNIDPGQILIHLDSNLFITYQDLFYHQFFNRIGHEDETQVDKKVVFAFYMTFIKKNKQINFQFDKKILNYIENLPLFYHNLICWSDQQLNLLSNKQLIKKIKSKKSLIIQKFNKIKKFYVQKAAELGQYIYDRFSGDQQDRYYNKGDESEQEQDYVLKQPEKPQIQGFLISSQHSQQLTKKSRYSHENRYRRNSNENQNFRSVSQEKSNNSTISQSQTETSIEQYSNLCKNILFQDFLIFYAAIQSRYVNYETPSDSQSQLGALVKLLEMFNHASYGQVQKQSTSVKCIAPIKKDQQIFVSYCQQSDQYLLQHYGILLDKDFEKGKNDWILEKQERLIINELVSKQRQSLAKEYNKKFQLKELTLSNLQSIHPLSSNMS